jgi:hypothetical protein
MKSTSFTTKHISEPTPRQYGEGPGVRLTRGIKFFAALAALALFTTCCKDDCTDPTNPNCANYDPCYGKTQPSAKFIMEEGGFREWQNGKQVLIYYPDSVFQGFGIRFRSELTDTKKYKHTWYLGAETFENVAQTPERSFGNVPRPSYITVIHVLEYTPDLQCFPDDDGKDSVAQQFRLIADYHELKTYGKFQGKLNDTGQIFTVEILPIRKYPGQPIIYWPGYGQVTDKMTINFNNEGDTLFGQTGSSQLSINNLNHHWWFKTDYEDFVGEGYIDDDGFFEMNYFINRWPFNNGDTIHHTFKGIKIE